MNAKLDSLPNGNLFFTDHENYCLINSKMQDSLSKMEPNSVDCIITDPPYHLESITKRFGKPNSSRCQFGNDGSFSRISRGFMGKEWDGGDTSFRKETWQLCLKVLKPGGNLIVFGGSRTFSRISVAIEDAGFEVKDTLMWLYGSGFPKSMDISKAIESQILFGKSSTQRKREIEQCSDGEEYRTVETRNGAMGVKEAKTRKRFSPTKAESKRFEGYGTCLKPAYEPIIWAMKPLDGTYASNALKWGTAGINVKEARIADEASRSEGRFPSNVVLTFSDEDKSEVCGAMPEGDKNGTIGKVYENGSKIYGKYDHVNEFDAYEDEGSASRYFYCAKASTKDRDEGLELGFEKTDSHVLQGRKEGSEGSVCLRENGTMHPNQFAGCGASKRNIHPTVKPTELMQYLCRLFAVRGGLILDPFMGSGSTGKAAMFENRERRSGYSFVGIEMTDEYLPLAKARIEYALHGFEYEQRKEEADKGQLHLF